MLRKIDRYVIRETIPPFLLSLVIFTFLLEIPPVMRDLEMLVAKGVSWQVAGRIVMTLIPQALGLTIPMALLTGLLIGLGRLSADRETVALLACGVSPHRLLRPVMLMATVCAAATTVRDGQGHPGRQPDVPGNHLRNHREAGRERRPSTGLLREFSRLGALRPRRTRRPRRLEGGARRQHQQAGLDRAVPGRTRTAGAEPRRNGGSISS